MERKCGADHSERWAKDRANELERSYGGDSFKEGEKNTAELRGISAAGTLDSLSALNVAEELADRIGVIKNGGLCAVGALDKLRQLPEGQKGENGKQSGIEDLFLALTEKGVLGVDSAE